MLHTFAVGMLIGGTSSPTRKRLGGGLWFLILNYGIEGRGVWGSSSNEEEGAVLV